MKSRRTMVAALSSAVLGANRSKQETIFAHRQYEIHQLTAFLYEMAGEHQKAYDCFKAIICHYNTLFQFQVKNFENSEFCLEYLRLIHHCASLASFLGKEEDAKKYIGIFNLKYQAWKDREKAQNQQKNGNKKKFSANLKETIEKHKSLGQKKEAAEAITVLYFQERKEKRTALLKSIRKALKNLPTQGCTEKDLVLPKIPPFVLPKDSKKEESLKKLKGIINLANQYWEQVCESEKTFKLASLSSITRPPFDKIVDQMKHRAHLQCLLHQLINVCECEILAQHSKLKKKSKALQEHLQTVERELLNSDFGLTVAYFASRITHTRSSSNETLKKLSDPKFKFPQKIHEISKELRKEIDHFEKLRTNDIVQDTLPPQDKTASIEQRNQSEVAFYRTTLKTLEAARESYKKIEQNLTIIQNAINQQESSFLAQEMHRSMNNATQGAAARRKRRKNKNSDPKVEPHAPIDSKQALEIETKNKEEVPQGKPSYSADEYYTDALKEIECKEYARAMHYLEKALEILPENLEKDLQKKRLKFKCLIALSACYQKLSDLCSNFTNIPFETRRRAVEMNLEWASDAAKEACETIGLLVDEENLKVTLANPACQKTEDSLQGEPTVFNIENLRLQSMKALLKCELKEVRFKLLMDPNNQDNLKRFGNRLIQLDDVILNLKKILPPEFVQVSLQSLSNTQLQIAMTFIEVYSLYSRNFLDRSKIHSSSRDSKPSAFAEAAEFLQLAQQCAQHAQYFCQIVHHHLEMNQDNLPKDRSTDKEKKKEKERRKEEKQKEIQKFIAYSNAELKERVDEIIQVTGAYLDKIEMLERSYDHAKFDTFVNQDGETIRVVRPEWRKGHSGNPAPKTLHAYDAMDSKKSFESCLSKAEELQDQADRLGSQYEPRPTACKLDPKVSAFIPPETLESVSKSETERSEEVGITSKSKLRSIS